MYEPGPAPRRIATILATNSRRAAGALRQSWETQVELRERWLMSQPRS